eukprot:TRINITY_DN20952_c0_g1_i1.p2 TRINITY_DN20952_c0_g1~~TRINITY_DN20952_c0_g1_i1.p2  ORF type:complete len:392 (+),score=53.72 TRINITY_DN20952_c0_g1_i1:73-1248(+)
MPQALECAGSWIIIFKKQKVRMSRGCFLNRKVRGSTANMDAASSRMRWELDNNIQKIEGQDELWNYDPAEHTRILNEKPWSQNPKYFQGVKISALALLKMAMHARSGGRLEVMGMLQGKVIGNSFVVIDCYALPVEGTETRVNAHEHADQFLVEYKMGSYEVGRREEIIGWYHSHPGYGCWLSGIDCETQMTWQQHSEPFLAIVVDPMRTMAAGKVEIGAFRTYPRDHKPADQGLEYQTIPMEKIEDFGVHANQYYQLEISYFKSTLDNKLLDLLWNKYWVNVLAANPLIASKDFQNRQIEDVTNKLFEADQKLQRNPGILSRVLTMKQDEKVTNPALQKIVKDVASMNTEQMKGLTSQLIKNILFNAALNQEEKSVQEEVKDDQSEAMET